MQKEAWDKIYHFEYVPFVSNYNEMCEQRNND